MADQEARSPPGAPSNEVARSNEGMQGRRVEHAACYGLATCDRPRLHGAVISARSAHSWRFVAQDAMLLGAHLPTLRAIASRFCALAGREAEHVSISRDTTESDLKQRREIVGGSITYSSQPVVNAALNGRVLILEGLEKVTPLRTTPRHDTRVSPADWGAFCPAPSRKPGRTRDDVHALLYAAGQ